MASSVRIKEPPDVFFKCHPDKLCTTVVCIICDAAFHKSDFILKKKNKGFFVTNTLVLCSDHEEVHITSLSQCEVDKVPARAERSLYKSIIAGLKLQLSAITNNNSDSFTDQNLASTLTTVSSASQPPCFTEGPSLAREYHLLEELNAELKEKNPAPEGSFGQL